MPPHEDDIRAFSQFSTSTISSALDDICTDGVIYGLLPLQRGMRLVGPAVTARLVTGKLGAFATEEFGLRRLHDALYEGAVVVVENRAIDVASWGELATLGAKLHGATGVVVDGCIRDVDEILEIGFPAFSRGSTPKSPLRRSRIVAVNEPVSVGGVIVSPADLIVGDSTGIVRVPSSRKAEIARKCHDLDAYDSHQRQIMKG